MIDNNDKRRESIIAAVLVSFCLISLVMGLFLIKKNTDLVNNDKAKLMANLSGDKVAVIGLEGVIFDSFRTRSAFKNILNVAYVKKELDKALEDPHTKAVILRMNSPGGTVAASQELYQTVMKFKNSGKPVVVSMSDVCASGCYYIASATDYIVANPGTITGSIGVISSGLNFKGLLDKLGIVDQTFKAGKFKDLGSGTRILTEDEKKILNELLLDSYDQFLDDVEKGRGIERAVLDELAQGLVYTGRQALAVDLVDELGSYEDTKLVVKKLLKEKYSYSKSKADSIKFEETWKANKLSNFDDIFDLGMSKAFSKLGLDLSADAGVNPLFGTQHQVWWLMP